MRERGGGGRGYTPWQMVLSGKEPDGKWVLQWSCPHEQCPGISMFFFVEWIWIWSGVEWNGGVWLLVSWRGEGAYIVELGVSRYHGGNC